MNKLKSPVSGKTGLTGILALACSGAPTGANCTAPTNVTVASGAASSFTVKVATSGSGSLLYPKGLKPSTPLFVACMVLAILLSLLAKIRFSREIALSPAPRQLAVWEAALACLVLLITVSGCGGGGGGSSTQSSPGIVAPSGTYTITMTPTAIAAGSTKALQLDPVSLTLPVK